jgi:EmrB/QacA subfamily drug resistance transporter
MYRQAATPVLKELTPFMPVLATKSVTERTPGVARRGDHPRIALAVILTCQLMAVLDATVVNVALPKIQDGLHFSSTNLSWVINAYALTLGGLLLLGGRAGDVLGRRRVFVAGITLFTLASMAGGLATSGGMLIVARAIQGVGAAIAIPNTLALLMISFPEGPARNRALGLFTAVSSAGGSIGLLVGGALTDWVSWRWVLFINVPIGVAIVVLIPLFLTEPPRRTARLGVLGALSSTLGVGSLVYGFIRAADQGWADTGTLASFAVAVLLLAFFIAHEASTAEPILPLRLFADRTRAGAYGVMLMLPAILFGTFFFLAQYLQLGLGLTPLRTGLAFMPLTLAIFGMSRLTPRWVSARGPRLPLLVGPVLLAVAALWLSQLSVGSTYWQDVFGPILLLGVGAGFTFMPLTTVILSRVPAGDAGAASGALQTMQQLGAALGLAVLVSVFGAATGDAGTRGTVTGALLTHGVSVVFGTAVVFAIAAWLVSAVLLRPRPPVAATVEQLEPETAAA